LRTASHPLPECHVEAVQFLLLFAVLGRAASRYRHFSSNLMEKPMMRFTLLLFMILLSGVHPLAAQQNVEARGITSVIKLEEVIFGHLAELNGKFKLRCTELTFAPGGYLGVHHHVGPGIRHVLSGGVTFTEGGQTTIYKAGDYFFETGNLAHTAQNETNLPLRILFVEILPKDWAGPAVVPPKP
jgi:quercetin dioxygenase-like cupin family protein